MAFFPPPDLRNVFFGFGFASTLSSYKSYFWSTNSYFHAWGALVSEGAAVAVFGLTGYSFYCCWREKGVGAFRVSVCLLLTSLGFASS